MISPRWPQDSPNHRVPTRHVATLVTARPDRHLARLILYAALAAPLAPAPGAARGAPRVVTLDAHAVEDDALVRERALAALRGDPGGSSVDTAYFGGLDETTGTAIPGGVWDFELDPGNTDPTEGWSSEDLTAYPVYVRRVTAEDFAGDPVSAVMTDGGSTGSIWFGAHEDEAAPGCWPGGMGYSNDFVLRAQKSFPYSGTGDVQIALDYFTDSETQFDYTYVYAVNDLGVRSPVLNTSINGRPADGRGYSGSAQEQSNLGTPAAPLREAMTAEEAVLPGGPADFEVLVEFDSDPLYSDGLDSFAGFLNSVYGPAGIDDVHVTGEGLDDLSDFETGTDGWTFSIEPPIGRHFAVHELSALDPLPEQERCACPLNGHVMVAAVTDGSSYEHPEHQEERLLSPPAYVGAPELEAFDDFIVTFDAWMDLPTAAGVGFRIGFFYYPWTCPATGSVGWTIETADNGGGYYFQNQPRCRTLSLDIDAVPPSGVDSLRVVFELLQGCDDFGGKCIWPQGVNQSPYWDNVRLALTGSGKAPVPTADLLYQDVFPNNPLSPGGSNTLLPNATIDVHSYLDLNRGDGNPTNAALGDSAVVTAGTDVGTQAFLNFRVYPGPETETNDPWFSRYGGDFIADAGSGAQDHWAKARLDTAETASGAFAGRFATYDWPDGSELGAKVIVDGVLTPGTTVQYFFSTSFAGSPDEQLTAPDTTGSTYFEFEALPGYFADAGASGTGNGVLAPCLLYVDAFNAGAQAPIEDKALRNLLGEVVDADGRAQDNWDRYDYLGAGASTPAPLAREANGDNGMTGYQSLFYKTIVYNTGTLSGEGLRDGDAALLQNFLVSDDFNRHAIQKGLWLSGDGIASILDRPDRPSANALLASMAGADLVCATYHAEGCGNDSTACVRLDTSAGSQFPQSAGYAARGNGCPTLHAFDVLTTTGDGVGNVVYVDQDAGEAETPFASVSNDQFAPSNPDNWGVVIDGFSVHHLRSTPFDFTGEACGDDSTAVLTRATDVLGFLNADLGPGTCGPPAIDPVPVDPGSAPAVTRLFPNAPNPFNPRTTIRYAIAARAHVALDLYDVGGRRVRTLVSEILDPGTYRIAWDGTTRGDAPAASGVYWVRLRTSEGFDGKTKVVMLK